ncbi:MAG: 2,3-bisphosphoglycerate-independent phosphoglycerate mutase [Chloroflexi bacterium]|nr:2,3-bisphosphoglycerate-independent phosphoglycerate mutase [Chloroflexota bacterium]MEB2364474.1 2,3-bisphosphoglycerate-independent phosphoglycerate mutase [Chloroflexota bacterium]OQY84204.1 MAG: phosphoglycerate mutase (2,3-diphosphoglycerate-independent) [Anaerolineae bacterium UTCFX5]RIK21760.1 MAG: 2,3-bisphosphoglycerate-independent phosphoglycerate mutase [Chloroflexota bacterium]
MNKRVMLVILDGLGIREMQHGNAVKQAKTPNIDRWMTQLERSIIDASEEAVGLTPGQMGNSEVGHLNLGAGRVVYQDITAINVAIRDGSFATNPTLLGALDSARSKGGRVHLLGLVSDGGVHSHINHLMALLKLTGTSGLQTYVHVITDGRDTPPTSGAGFVEQVEAALAGRDDAKIATVSGRYYAMDRDKRWERTQRAFDAMVHRHAPVASSAVEAINASYARDVTDEFIEPVVIGDDPDAAVKPGDSVICFNFRADRMRQIVQALVVPERISFPGTPVSGLHVVTFTEYMEDLPVSVVFGNENLVNTLAEVLSRAGLRQYHSAETEKYPHVTFFFNGRREEPWPGEDRRIIPSPKVATYDLKPEMSAYELTEATLERIQTGVDDFILINYANPDMVGHTGVLSAGIKAVETVDECAAKIVAAWNAAGGIAIVTADHGNCERMIEETTGEPHTYHTTNPVSLFVIGDGYTKLRPRGALCDVAPTVLDLMGVPQPPEMTGHSLIDRS